MKRATTIALLMMLTIVGTLAAAEAWPFCIGPLSKIRPNEVSQTGASNARLVRGQGATSYVAYVRRVNLISSVCFIGPG
jgi:hypothetical protein